MAASSTSMLPAVPFMQIIETSTRSSVSSTIRASYSVSPEW